MFLAFIELYDCFNSVNRKQYFNGNLRLKFPDPLTRIISCSLVNLKNPTKDVIDSLLGKFRDHL